MVESRAPGATFKLDTNDPFSLLMKIVLDFGVISGLWGLLALQATGPNRVFQALTFLPITGIISIFMGAGMMISLIGIIPDPDWSVSWAWV